MRRHRRRPDEPVGRTEGLIECESQQATVCDPRCALVMLGRGEDGLDGQLLASGDGDVQSRRMVDPAPEAVPVVARNRRAGRRGLGVACRGDRIGWDSQRMRIHDGNDSEPWFRERLWPSLPVIGFAALIAVSFGIAFDHAYGWDVGVAVLLITGVGATVALVATAPLLRVDARGLQAGVAVLPWEAMGRVRALDRDATRQASGPRAHRAAFFLLRGWLPESVIIEVVDAQDPHPYWHVSTRRRDDLVAALTRDGE